MIIIDPESVGCGRKVPVDMLETFQRVFEEAYGARLAFSDYAMTSMAGGTIVTSIDRTVRFCEDYSVFVEAAVAHASNDVICGGAQPTLASVSIGFTRSQMESLQAEQIVAALAVCLGAKGIQPGKFHSYVDVENSLTVSVLGAKQLEFSEIGAGDHGDIYMSKPLGAFKSAYLSTIRQVDLIPKVRSALRSFDNGLGSKSHMCVALSDISGFGMVHCVDQLLAQNGLHGQLYLSSVPLIEPETATTEVECLLKGKEYVPSRLRVEGGFSVVGALTEVNGPMVALVKSEYSQNFDGTWFRVGKWGI